MSHNHHGVFIGLGSNLGDRKGYIRRAIAWIEDHPDIEVKRCSELRETEPWGVVEQPRFINAVIVVSTSLDAHELLRALKSAEIILGRLPRSQRWGPREIDIDILLYGNEIIDDVALQIPHPRLVDRPFVLEQVVEVDGAVVHPVLRVPVRALLDG